MDSVLYFLVGCVVGAIVAVQFLDHLVKRAMAAIESAKETNNATRRLINTMKAMGFQEQNHG